MQLNMDRLLRETTRPEREPARERRQSEINEDGRKKVTAQGEPECENVSAAEGKRESAGVCEMTSPTHTDKQKEFLLCRHIDTTVTTAGRMKGDLPRKGRRSHGNLPGKKLLFSRPSVEFLPT